MSEYLRVGDAIYRRVVGRSKWKPSSFSSHFNIPEDLLDSWDVDEEKFMNSRELETGQEIHLVAWHPISGELLFGGIRMYANLVNSHADLINDYGSHLYDDYITAYSFSIKTLVVQPWYPDAENLDEDPDEILCFEGQYAFKEVFERSHLDWKTDLRECDLS